MLHNKTLGCILAIALYATPALAAPPRIIVSTSTIACPTEQLMSFMEQSFLQYAGKLDGSGRFSLLVPVILELKANGCYLAPEGAKGYLAGPTTGADGFPQAFVQVRLDGNPAIWWIPLFNIEPTS